jgi:hypothetical protein
VSDFEFDFGGVERGALLAEAREMIGGLESTLGDAPAPSNGAAVRLLEQLNGDVAEFSAYPEVVRLEKKHFKAHGLAVPTQFDTLTKQVRFYWLRFPITLSAPQGLPFRKLECAIEFNPEESAGHLRPVAQTILPDEKFKSQLELSGQVDVSIGPKLEFEAGLPPVPIPLPIGSGSAAGAIDAKLAAKMGVVAGPFTYRLRKALVTHTGTGSQKVVWRLVEADFAQDDSAFIVVMKVPRQVDEIKIAGAMQAYHEFSLADAGLVGTISYFTERLRNFFRKGAPVTDTSVWDVSPSL